MRLKIDLGSALLATMKFSNRGAQATGEVAPTMSGLTGRFSLSLLAVFSLLVAGCGGGGSTPPPPPPPAAPTVVSTVPADAATAVALNTVVSATFSLAIDASTITATTFTLTGPGTTAVAGAVTASGSTATFTPSAPLTNSTLYTATVTTGVKSQSGVALAANHVWTFTTVSGATGNFSNASLSGQFAFSVSGRELCNGAVSLFARAGTFISDGNGNITSGLEDVNICTGVQTLPFTAGTYSIGGDGRGTISLTNSTGTTHYTVALSSSSEGFIAPTDANTTANGSFQKQTTGAFSTSSIAGGYVFEFKGINATPTHASFIGRFTADGAGGISNGLFDSDIGGTLSGQLAFPAGASYQVDASSNGSTFGRGTATIAGQTFAFYVVDATHLKLLGTGFPSEYVGDAFAQQNVSFGITSLNGSYAFSLSGTSASGGLASAGRFTADGAGNISNVVADENNSGTVTLLPKGTGTVTGTYTVDANHLGGGTLAWTDPAVATRTFSFIFYLISPTKAVVQETDASFTSDGTFSSQTTSPITLATLAGDYALGLSGANQDEQQFVGQLTLTSGGSFTGQTYFSHIVTVLNQFTTNQQFTNVPINGNLTLSTGGTGANVLAVNLQITPSDTFNFSVYVVDQNTLLLIGSDTNREVVGTLSRQH